MPTIDTSDQTSDFSMPNVNATGFFSYVGHGNSFYTYQTLDGHRITLQGGGITVDGGNLPTGGVIGALTIDLLNDSPSNPDIVISNLGFLLTDLGYAGGVEDNNLFWQTVLSGAAIYSTPMDFRGIFVGDGVRPANETENTVVLGGNDELFGGDTNNLSLVGDYLHVDSGLCIGGDDTLTGAFDFAFGDVNVLDGRLLGGMDLFDLTINWTADASVLAVGDAGTVDALGTAIGGDDTIDASFLSDQLAANVLVGDVNFLSAGALVTGGDDLILGSQGNDAIFGDVRDNEMNSFVVGGHDHLFGNSGDDTIFGDIGLPASAGTTGGNDHIDGGTGADSLLGNGGDDTLIGGSGADQLDGGEGSDWASYLTAQSAVRGRLDGIANTFGDALGDTLNDIENLQGSDFNDTLIGNSSANIIDGGAGNDTLFGGAGADTLIGGFGADLLHGQGGNDTASYMSSNIGVGVRLDGIAGSGGAAGDRLFTIENLEGSQFGDTLIGDDAANHLDGFDGSDTVFAGLGDDLIDGGRHGDLLYGQAGDDTIAGGGGNDTLIGGAGADFLNGNAGSDTASYAGATGGVSVRMDGFAGTAGWATGDRLFNIEAVTGSAFGDTIIGSSGTDLLRGGAGNDVLFASGGADTLMGGLGADTLHGQNGIDTASYAEAAGGVSARLDGVAGGGGAAAGDRIFTVENLIGSAFNDTLIGSGSNNLIEGGAGNDTIFAGNGNDTLTGGAGDDVLFGQAGLDRFVFAEGFGNDAIHGFNATNAGERIDLSAISAITNYVDLSGNHIAQVGADVVIDGLAGNTITLLNVDLADLDASDFVF